MLVQQGGVSPYNKIDYLNISTRGNGVDFGDTSKNLYEEVNSDYDYIEFNTGDALAGMTLPDTTNMNLFDKFREIEGFGRTLLRYRFDGPPTVTSVRPNRVNMQCKFVACLDGD